VAQADTRRKGLRTGLRYGALLVAAPIIALPFSFVTGVLLTPLLWRLEPVLGLELAGHSGPSDWILESIFGITTVLVVGLGFAVVRRAKTTGAADSQPAARRERAASAPRASWAGDCDDDAPAASSRG
jgi:hypothetical protein